MPLLGTLQKILMGNKGLSCQRLMKWTLIQVPEFEHQSPFQETLMEKVSEIDYRKAFLSIYG